MADQYGIPEGGNTGAWSVKRWRNINHALTWKEMIASVALGGWPESKWAEAAATAAAESSRNPFIYNTAKLGHFGLFQISRSAHPEFFSGGDISWMSPWMNAQMAYAVYRKEGWKAWQAHTSGAYVAYLAQARAAVTAVKKGGSGTAYWKSLYTQKTNEYIALIALTDGGKTGELIGGAIAPGIQAGASGLGEAVVASGAAAADTAQSMASVVTGVWEALTTPALWMRLGYGTLGVVLVAGGLFLVVRQRPAVQAATKAVAGVVPGGAALKAVKGGKAA